MFSLFYSSLNFCRAYAQAIKNAGIQFDVFFGPAYKGIPLAAGVATAWYDLFQEDKIFAYNRKEKKDHGEVRRDLLPSYRSISPGRSNCRREY